MSYRDVLYVFRNIKSPSIWSQAGKGAIELLESASPSCTKLVYYIYCAFPNFMFAP